MSDTENHQTLLDFIGNPVDDITPPDMVVLWLADLPEEDVFPTPKLVESVRRWGVRDPIHVALVDGFYKVVSGHRRIAAAREAGLIKIPACVYDDVGDALQATMALESNALRSRNIDDELKRITELVDMGFTESDIAKATSMPVGTIRKRMALLNLSGTFLQAMRDGDVAAGTLESIAKLPKKYQTALLDSYDETGRITASDVHDVTRQRREVASATLDDAIFSNPVSKADAVLDAARAFVRCVDEESKLAGIPELDTLVVAVHEMDGVRTTESDAATVVNTTEFEPVDFDNDYGLPNL